MRGKFQGIQGKFAQITLGIVAVAAQGSAVASTSNEFDFAAYATGNGCGAITLSGNAYTDSFDSSQGSYSQTKQLTRGDIGVTGNATLNGSATVNGSIFALNTTVGECHNGAPGITLSGKATATQGYLQLSAAPVFAAPPPPIAGSQDYHFTSDATLAPGNYGNITLSGHITLTLSPGIYDFNSLTLTGNSILTVSPSGQVVINVAGNNVSQALDLSGGSISNPSGLPLNFQLIYGGTLPIAISGGPSSYAVLYAPHAPVALAGGSDWYGAMVVGTLDDSGGVALHYDRSLAVPPTITALISPAPNAAGWNNSNVTVTFTCSDLVFGIVSCSSPVQVTTEGAGQIVTGTTMNQAGFGASTSVTLDVDKTPPVLSIASPANGTTVNPGSIAVMGTATDALSGLASVTCDGITATLSGSNFSCMVPIVAGPNMITVQVTDKAGNSVQATVSVQGGIPTIVSVNPNTGQQSQQNLSVAIAGQFTHFVQGTTTASFGTGITVASLTVISATSGTVVLNIDPAAAMGVRDVTLTTAGETASLANGFTVNAAAASGRIVVGHDVNTLSSSVAGPNEAQFAVNIADWLTGAASGKILAVESSPGDGTRDYAPIVKTALAGGGFAVTYISNPATVSAETLEDLQAYNAIFVGETWPTEASISSAVLTQYVNAGGNVYAYGGVDASPAAEAAFLNPFLQAFGLAFDTTTYNGLNSVNITSTHPIFNGLTGKTLGSGNGQDIHDLGTDPNASIIQFQGVHGVYAIVNSTSSGLTTITTVAPNTGQQGQQNLSVAITGQNTHFAQGTTTASFGAGITVVSLTVNSPTSATAVINIDPAAAIRAYNVTLTTGSEIGTLTNGFNVTALSSIPTITSISPSSGLQGQQNLSVAITGQFTHFVQGTTTANFGSGITVASLTVISATNATAVLNISPAVAPGVSTVTLTTGAEVASLVNGFTIQAISPVIEVTSAATYSYQSNPFTIFQGSYQCTAGVGECNISGSFTVPTPLPPNLTNANYSFVPLSFSFTDGVNPPLTQNNAPCGYACTGPEFIIYATDPAGIPTQWDIQVATGGFCPRYEIATYNQAGAAPYDTSYQYLADCTFNNAQIYNHPASWTVSLSSSGQQGQQSLSVAITGQFTHFVQGATIASFGTGITVVSLTIHSATTATAVVNINPGAALGARDVTLTTGAETATAMGSFTVTSSVSGPTITTVSPSSGPQGLGGPVGIVGLNTHFAQGTTAVDFGPGITVSNINVTCPTCLTVQLQIDANAALGPRTVAVTTGSEVVSLANGFTVVASSGGPILTSLVPAGGQQGQSLGVTITGQNTHFTQGTTQVSFGAGITVSNVSVSTATSLTAQLVIDPLATVGTRTLTVTTGTEVESVANVFNVQASTPILFSLNPGSGLQGQTNLSVAITGVSTHFVQGTSVASFGAGVTVVSLTVASATAATAVINIDSAATLGTRTVTVTTSSEIASFVNGFTVQTASSPILLSLNPGGTSQGAQNLSVSIVGQNTHFVQGTSIASFGAGITVVSITVSSPTQAAAVVNVDPAAALGPRTVTVTTGSEMASFVNGFTIIAGVAGITSINPGGGPQGASNLSVAVTAQFTHFVQGTTTASFGAGVTVASLTITSPTTATVSVNVASGAALGARDVTFTTGTEVVTASGGFTVQAAGTPTLVSVSPSSGQPGTTGPVGITGQNTHFVQGTTQVSLGAGITVGTVSVTSPTALTAQITIASGAATGPRTVTVTTGTEIVSLPNGFSVNTGTHQPPVITIAPTWSDTLPNRLTVTYTVTDDGLAGPVTVSWSTITTPPGATVGYQSQTPTSISVGFDTAGVYTLNISASDSQFTASQNITVTVTGTSISGPTVSIATPVDGGEVTTLTSVTGTVNSAALTSWTLAYQPPGGTAYQTLATGTSTITNGALGTFDPTLLLNGIAYLRLSATDVSGQTSSTTISLVLTRNQKVGNFTVSFNDLTVPVAGLPIQVVRTYDSRRRAVPGPDFSYGWTLDLKTATITESVALGDQWSEASSGGIFPSYCVQPVQAHVVTVTLNDGTTYEFTPTLNPSCQSLVPIQTQQVTIGFSPAGATPPNAALAILGNNQPWVIGAVPGPVTLTDTDLVTTLDPDQYILTLPDGRTMQLSMQSGLQKMTDLNGNTLTVTSAGITSSTGKSVTFTRNAAKLITQITDPNGGVIHYAYDLTTGDLTSVTDQAGNTSTFTYAPDHGLLTIVDPAEVQPIRNTYDASGRLISHTDAYGHVITYTYSPGTSQESVTDRLGNLTVNNYDTDGNIVQMTDALGGVTRRTYDSRDNLLTETNPLNETHTYTYDAQNNRLTDTDPLGGMTTYTYNSRNQVLTITDPLGRVTMNTYDASGNLLSSKDAAGNVTTYTYNSNGLRVSLTDPLGGVTAYQYDASGDLTRQTDALGNVTNYTYDANGNKLSETKTRTTASGPQTLVTNYQYDSLNRLTQTTYPDGSATQIQYNAIGKQGVTIDQLGHQTSYQYDLMGRLTLTTYADGTTEGAAYDAEGDRISSTDRAGRTTTYTYDPLKRLTQTTYPDSAVNQTTYDAAGEVTQVTDARGNATKYGYDAAGRRTSVTDALNHVTGFAYDAAGNQSSMTDANGHTTQYQYDPDNRRVRTVYPDFTTDTVAYDALGRTISKTDQAGAITQFQYDRLGRLVQVTDALSQITAYSYDEVGNRLTQTDANHHTTSFAYDKLGRRTQRTLPLGMSETMTYDAAGNLRTKIDFDGKTTTYNYDIVNRLTSKAPDVSFGAAAVSFAYTATGQRQMMTDASGTTSYNYDLRDRLTQKAAPEGTLSYTYDAAGNLLSIGSSNAGGTSVNYTYDALNRLSTAKDNRLASGTTSYAYDNAGNLQNYLYPNGVQTGFTYNTLNRLTNITLATGSTLASYAYTLGAAGNRTQVTELGGRQVNYTYDALYRLTGETIAGGSVNGAIGYTYDAVGNRLSRTSTVGPVSAATSSYDANDRLSTDTYDADGNTTAAGSNTYAYDFENHLQTENGGAVTIVYDGDGNRVSKTASGVTTKYLVDDRNLTGYAQVLEEIAGGAVQRVYTYGLNRISQSQATGTSFYAYDGHGNVRILTDTTGAVTDRYDYDAFGNIISQAGTTPNVYLYSGEQNDPSLSLYYLRARYLSQSTGRFWTMDTVEGESDVPISLHKYTYVGNEPVVRVDPSGNQFDIASISFEVADFDVLSSVTTVHAGGLFNNFNNIGQQLTFNTVSGGPGFSTWVVQWKLFKPSISGGWVVQNIMLSRAPATTVPNFWEAWRIPAGSNITDYALTGDINDDTFNLSSGTTVNAEARFYEELQLPSSFIRNNPATLAHILPSTIVNPNLPTTNATGPVDRTWTAP